jgi:hypothetical protein
LLPLFYCIISIHLTVNALLVPTLAIAMQLINDTLFIEKIKSSEWWALACNTVDSHYSNDSGVMLSHHLEAVYDNVVAIFTAPPTAFYTALFDLLKQFDLTQEAVFRELKVIALLHDIGKPREDKSLIIAHPLTGKDAHRRHGLVSLMATMDILGNDLADNPAAQQRIYRTVELHDMSYGLFRTFLATGDVPKFERWNYINNKIYPSTAVGLLYLMIFKLADIHGHGKIDDVLWFYETVQQHYFDYIQVTIPIPKEEDIR